MKGYYFYLSSQHLDANYYSYISSNSMLQSWYVIFTYLVYITHFFAFKRSMTRGSDKFQDPCRLPKVLTFKPSMWRKFTMHPELRRTGLRFFDKIDLLPIKLQAESFELLREVYGH